MRNKDIPEFTQTLLKEHGITETPVDVLRIAKASGVKVVRNSIVTSLSEGEHGRMYSAEGLKIIVYDDTLPLHDRRFTVAHELGHIFLDHEGEHRRFTNHIERQADMFARCLLDPQGGYECTEKHT